MDTINKLVEQFRQFPGIGPRQAKRFVYFLLTQPESYRSTLARSVTELGGRINACSSCQRFFPINNNAHHAVGAKNLTGKSLAGKNAATEVATECSICTDPNRTNEILLIVSRDIDLENIEKSGTYTGKYFVLGGSVPILEKEPESRIRLKELKNLIEKRATVSAVNKANDAGSDVNKTNPPLTNTPLKEIIFALNLTPEGENTEEFLRATLAPLLEQIAMQKKGTDGAKISLSSLGRGLSTGLELEYSDSETIKNALKNRA